MTFGVKHMHVCTSAANCRSLQNNIIEGLVLNLSCVADHHHNACPAISCKTSLLQGAAPYRGMQAWAS